MSMAWAKVESIKHFRVEIQPQTKTDLLNKFNSYLEAFSDHVILLGF